MVSYNRGKNFPAGEIKKEELLSIEAKDRQQILRLLMVLFLASKESAAIG